VLQGQRGLLHPAPRRRASEGTPRPARAADSRVHRAGTGRAAGSVRIEVEADERSEGSANAHCRFAVN
jgi:hypothetical protein